MSESNDYNPGDWAGHDFGAARKAYDAHAGRSYDKAVSAGKKAVDLVAATIETQSQFPLIIRCDVTGSMGAWPATIFSKLPYLDIEGKQYLGPDMEVSFGAIGDAVMGDKYPFQVRPFGKGTDLAEQLKGLVIEGGGGGDKCESYELSALYDARNVKCPNALKPIHIIIGDEGIHEYVEVEHAKNAQVVIQARISYQAVFEELKRRFAVYVIRKDYGEGYESRIQKQWVDLLGEDHVVRLDDPNRVVDVIFGILAKETGRVAYFKEELEGRQTPEQVKTVYDSLKTVHVDLDKDDKDKNEGHSTMFLPSGKGRRNLLGLGPKPKA
jgi:hypothetical protein